MFNRQVAYRLISGFFAIQAFTSECFSLEKESCQDIYFEPASIQQVDYLTELACRSISIYDFPAASKKEILLVVQVTKEHIERGLIRLMKKNEILLGFFGLFSRIENGEEINTMRPLHNHPSIV